jgi:hypothetical protein
MSSSRDPRISRSIHAALPADETNTRRSLPGPRSAAVRAWYVGRSMKAARLYGGFR